MQAVADFWFAVVSEVEESADFGEGEWDQAPMDGWCGFRFGRFVAWIVPCAGGWVEPFGVVGPLFLVVCAVMAKKVWASMEGVMCRCQAHQVRTW